MALLPKTNANANAPVAADSLTLQGGNQPGDPITPTKYDDAAALQITVQNARRFSMWISERKWTLRWHEAQTLYQSPRMITAWEGTETTKANVSDYMVLEHVNAIHPQAVKAFFYENPPFEIIAVPGSDSDAVAAAKVLLGVVLKKIGFRKEVSLGLLSDCLLGKVIMKVGWQCINKVVTKRVRKARPVQVDMPIGGPVSVPTKESDEFEIKTETVTEQWPWVEYRNIEHLLVDPDCRTGDIQEAKGVVDEGYVTFHDLDKMRTQIKPDGTPVYKIPSREQLLAFFMPPAEPTLSPAAGTESDPDSSIVHTAAPRWQKTNEDPLQCPMKIQEYTDNDNVFVVLQEDLVIRNDVNEFGRQPYRSANWWEILNSFHGIGVGRVVGQKQRVKQGTTNAALDVLTLELNTPFLVSRGANVATQNIRAKLGGFVEVDGPVDKAYAKPPMPNVPPEVWTMLAANAASAEASSGADAVLTQGQMSQRGRGGAMRTPAGARATIGANATKLDGPLGRFIDNVFVPCLEDIWEMIINWMPESQIRKIIGKMLGPEFGNNLDMEKFLNLELEFEALAGAYLAAQKAMALSVPLVIQLLENGVLLQQLQDVGWTIDVLKLAKAIADGTESKNFKQLFREMTAQEIKSRQDAKAAAGQQQVAGKVQVENVRGQNKKEEIALEHQAELAANIIQDALPRATGSELRAEAREQV